MILTTCAACAKPMEHDAPARCVSCETRYCSDRCERYDRRRGGHGKICGAIAGDGGAEQHHANKKYEEAVADAVEKCADDTQGQTCFICLDGDAEEGLVRGCSCRGAAGFVHISCLARQAKVLIEEAEERDLGGDAFNARWLRWQTCGLCEQDYHGVVACALGWACWKAYVGRPDADETRKMAMTELGNGLYAAYHYEDALSVREADLAVRRLGTSEHNLLILQGNLANSYEDLERFEQALSMRQEVYSGWLKLKGEEHESTLLAANNYADSLVSLNRFEEAKALLRKAMPVARRVLGESHMFTLTMRESYAETLYKDDGATRGDLREAVTTLEDTERTARRVLGGAHPTTEGIEDELQDARDALYARGLP